MGCNAACQAKVLLNGGNIVGVAKANYDVLKRFRPEQFEQLQGSGLIEVLNRMEDDAVTAQKMIAKAAGYTGPTGKMLEGE